MTFDPLLREYRDGETIIPSVRVVKTTTQGRR